MHFRSNYSAIRSKAETQQTCFVLKLVTVLQRISLTVVPTLSKHMLHGDVRTHDSRGKTH